MSLIYERKSSVLDHFQPCRLNHCEFRQQSEIPKGLTAFPLNMPQVGKRNEDQIYTSCGNEFINGNANGKPIGCIADQYEWGVEWQD